MRETEAPPNPQVVEMIAAAPRGQRRSPPKQRQKSAPEALMALSVVMPALEMAQETGKLVSWRKTEGEPVRKGEMLLEMETDKAVVEVEAPATVSSPASPRKRGDVIPVGQTIAWLVQPGETPPTTTSPNVATGRRTDPSVPAAVAPTVSSPASGARLSPKARRISVSKDVVVKASPVGTSQQSGADFFLCGFGAGGGSNHLPTCRFGAASASRSVGSVPPTVTNGAPPRATAPPGNSA